MVRGTSSAYSHKIPVAEYRSLTEWRSSARYREIVIETAKRNRMMGGKKKQG
jgi:hypothetical protein